MARLTLCAWPVLTLLAVLFAAPAAAEACKDCWNSSCPAQKAIGLPACATEQPPTKGPTTKAPPKAKAPKACPAGKERTIDTLDHCCWPGQAWAGDRCVGSPSSCPDEWEVDGEQCVLPVCDEGMKRAADGLHCCWPGQAWSSTRETCIGELHCPPEWLAPETQSCVGGYCVHGEPGRCMSPTEATTRRDEQRTRVEAQQRAEAERQRLLDERAASDKAAADERERRGRAERAEAGRRQALREARIRQRDSRLAELLPRRATYLDDLKAWNNDKEAFSAWESEYESHESEVVGKAIVGALPAVIGIGAGVGGFVWANAIQEHITSGFPSYASGDDIGFDAGLHNVVVVASWVVAIGGAALTANAEYDAFMHRAVAAPRVRSEPTYDLASDEIDDNGDGVGDRLLIDIGQCDVCGDEACRNRLLPSCTEPLTDDLAEHLKPPRAW